LQKQVKLPTTRRWIDDSTQMAEPSLKMPHLKHLQGARLMVESI